MALDNELKTRALKWVLDRRTKARNATTGRRAKWAKWYQHYRTYRNWKKNWPWRSKIFPPLAFGQVESAVPKIVSAVFGARPFIRALPRQAHEQDAAKTIERHLDHRFQQMKLTTRAIPWLKMAPMYGTALAQIPWRKERQIKRYQVTQRKSENGIPLAKRVWVNRSELLYEGPWFDPIDIFDWDIDPGATESDFSNADYIIIHKTSTVGRLQAQMKSTQNPNALYERFSVEELKRTTDATGDPDAQWRADRIAAIGLDIGVETLKPSQAVEILDYWGLFDIDGDGKEEQCIITVANDTLVIRCSLCPYKYWPLILFPYVPVEEDIYGIGILEPNETTTDGLLTIRNQRIDNVSQILNGMWSVHRGSHIKRHQLISRPGGIIEYSTKPPERIVPPDVRAAGYNEEEIGRRDMDVGGGSTAQLFTQGAGTSRQQDRTLGEVEILRGEGLSRIDLVSRLLQEGAITRLAEIVLMLDRQFMEHDETLRIGGAGGFEFLTITPETLETQVDLEPTSLISLSNKEAQIQKFLLAYDRIAQIEGINQTAIAKRLMEILDIKNPDEFFEAQEAAGGALSMPEAGEVEFTPEEQEQLMGVAGGRY